MVVPPLPGHIWGLDIGSDWGIIPVKQKACKPDLQARVFGHAKWRPVSLS